MPDPPRRRTFTRFADGGSPNASRNTIALRVTIAVRAFPSIGASMNPRLTRQLRKFTIASVVIVAGVVGLYLIGNPERATLDAAARADATGRFIQLTFGVTHYELTGPDTGPTVVLVHGFSVPYYIWDSTATALAAAGFRVLRYDTYGRGWSDRPNKSYTAALFDGQLRDLLDSLHLTLPVHLVGLSMGGPVSAFFADHYPQHVRSLTLVDPAVSRERLQRLFAIPIVGAYLWQVLAVPGMADSQLEDFVDPSRFPDWPDRYRVQMRYKGFGRALRSTQRHGGEVDLDSLYTRVGRSPLPVLILWGTGDRTVPFALSDGLRKRMPNAEFRAIENAGHVPTLEQAHNANAVLVTFLRTVSAAHQAPAVRR